MPEKMTPTYMNLNEFLETFFAAQDNREDRIGYLPNMVASNPELQRFGDAVSFGPNGKKIYEQYWAAREDNSPAAADFLNMIKNITVWYADYDRRPRYGLEDSCKAIMRLCQSGKIKNQFALRLLNAMKGQFTYNSPQNIQILHLIAINPAAKPIDVSGYAAIIATPENKQYYNGAPEELMGLLNDQMVKTDERINKELTKDFPNIDSIKKMGGGSLIDIAKNILRIVEFQVQRGERNIGDYDEIKKIIAALVDKYDIDNILKVGRENYVQQFEDAASLKLAKMEPQYEKMERDLGVAQKSQREMRSAYDEQLRQIRELEDKIAKLESRLDTEKSKNNTLRATVNTFIMDAETRANGGMVNIRKDILEQIKKLKSNMDQGHMSI